MHGESVRRTIMWKWQGKCIEGGGENKKAGSVKSHWGGFDDEKKDHEQKHAV